MTHLNPLRGFRRSTASGSFPVAAESTSRGILPLHSANLVDREPYCKRLYGGNVTRNAGPHPLPILPTVMCNAKGAATKNKFQETFSLARGTTLNTYMVATLGRCVEQSIL